MASRYFDEIKNVNSFLYGGFIVTLQMNYNN